MYIITIDIMIKLNLLQCRTIDELYARQDLLGITENDKVQKIAFGFFLEGNHGIKIPETLIFKYEHLAGSLSLHTLTRLIDNFLHSDLIKDLNPRTVDSLQKLQFIYQKAEAQAVSIDLIRSKNLMINIFAATNYKIFEPADRIEIDETELEGLVEAHLKQLNEIQDGQKAMFLFGALSHEAQMTMKKTGSRWELSYFDSDSPDKKTLKNFLIDRAIACDPRFWRELYHLKFQNSEQKFPSKFIKMNSLQEIRHPAEIQGKKQRYATCHILSQMGVIKKEILCHTHDDPDIAYLEWVLFKTLFGKHLLNQDLITDPELLTACIKRQESRERNSIVARNLYSGLHETTQEYLKAFKLLGIESGISDGCSRLKALNKLRHHFRNELNRHVVDVKLMRAVIGKTTNSWIEKTLEEVEQEAATKSIIVAAKLKDELSLTLEQRLYEKGMIGFCGFYNQVCDRIEEIAEKAGITYLEHLDRKVVSVANLPRAALEKHQFDEALKVLTEHPQKLQGLKNHPACQNVLIQAIQEGYFSSVESIYQQLLPEDKSYLKWLLQNWAFFKPLFDHQKDKYLSQFPESVLKEIL